MSEGGYCTRIVLEAESSRQEEADAVGIAVLKLLGGFGDAARELCRGHSSLSLKATAYPSRRTGVPIDDGAVVAIARVCHEANRGWCEANGDHSQRSWNEAEQWQRDSAIAGVRFALDNPDAPASAQHDAWSRDKVADGWTYGPVKDAAVKTHPCLVPFEQLPAQQQAKDRLFKAVVASLSGL